jgi:prephenate dehydratase
LVGRTPCPHSDTKKTSLVLALEKDRPGGLYEVLGEFARLNINLTKIESRPAKKELGNYIFFIDCEAGHDHPGLQEVLCNLEKKTALLKNLGSYNLIS